MKDKTIREDCQNYEHLSGEFFPDDSVFLEEDRSLYQSSRDFVSLDAWKKCRALRNKIYEVIIPRIPPEEKYALGSQIRRASQSITLNIAEGYGRFHYKEGVQFYRISRGSLYEIKDLLIIASDMRLISEAEFQDLLHDLEDAKATLAGYIRFVQSKAKNK